jgi:hypothetical protein
VKGGGSLVWHFGASFAGSRRVAEAATPKQSLAISVLT